MTPEKERMEKQTQNLQRNSKDFFFKKNTDIF
jgi:hypothetical protein